MKYGTFFYGMAVAGVLTFAGAAQASSVNIVQNGSFENPAIADGSYIFTDDLPGWMVEKDKKVEVRNNVAGAAYDGKNYVELDSDKGNMSIWQTLTTVVNQAYQITFAYSPRENQPASTNPINVQWNGVTQLLNQTVTGDGASSGNAWVIYTFNIVADSVFSELKFTAGGTSNTYGGGIDAVAVSTVPLPGAALMFGSALLGAGALRKRKAGEQAQSDALAA